MAITINVKLKPKASKRAVKVRGPKDMEVSVTASPIDNRANDQLTEYIADILGVAKSSVSIIKGGHSRNKVVSIEGLGEEDVFERMASI